MLPTHESKMGTEVMSGTDCCCTRADAEGEYTVVMRDGITTHAKIHQVDATLFVEQHLNNVVIKVQQHLTMLMSIVRLIVFRC